MNSALELRHGVATGLGDTLADLIVGLIHQRPRDISLTAASVLGTLERGGPMRLGELASSEGVAQPSMSALVAHLEKLGLVERHSDASDRRGVLVAITGAGRRQRARRRRTLTGTVDRAIAELSADDLAALAAALPALGRLAAAVTSIKGES
jgi:DNA-binding MarR family transcriptional regulator